MRTLTETRVVPADEVTITRYGCDLCDFVADDKDTIEEHHAKEHACLEKRKAGGDDLYRFGSEEDAKSWLSGRNALVSLYRVRGVEWAGPGWYATETWEEPCPRGCCTDFCIKLIPDRSPEREADRRGPGEDVAGQGPAGGHQGGRRCPIRLTSGRATSCSSSPGPICPQVRRRFRHVTP